MPSDPEKTTLLTDPQKEKIIEAARKKDWSTLISRVEAAMGNSSLLDRAVAVLKAIQWASDGNCPNCGRNWELGHTKVCSLAAVLADAERGGKK